MAFGGNGITIDKIDGALTKFYIPKMWELIQTSTPGLEYFKDMGQIVDWSGPGYKGHFKTRQKGKKGVVGGRVGRLPDAGAPSFSEPEIEYTVFRNLIQFEWDAKMRSSQERYDKLKRIIEASVEDCGDEFRRRLNTYLYTKGNIVGVCTGTSVADTGSAASATFTMVSPHIKGGSSFGVSAGYKSNGACQYIEPGDQLMIDAAGTTNCIIVEVLSVNRTTGVVNVVSDSDDATVAEFTDAVRAICDNGAKIYFAATSQALNTIFASTASVLEQTDLNAGLDGMGDILGDYSASQSYLGKTKTGFWDNVDQHNSGTNRALSLVLIDRLLGQMNDQRFVYPNLMIMNTGMFHEFNDLAEKNHAFFNQGDLPGGHSPQTRKKYFTVKTTMAQGDLDILVDKYAPMEQITVVDTENIGYANVYKEAEAKEDGSFLRHSDSDYDVWHGWTRWAGQFFSMSPAAVGRLNDITQDIRNL